MKQIKIILIASAALLLLGVLFSAGPANATDVIPTPYEGNPTCADFGYPYGFGFKIDGSADGTYPFIDGYGALTGGAPQDPFNSVTISNSDGYYFDWSATLGIDAVIVKGGQGSIGNFYEYIPEETSDTGLHPPMHDGKPYGISHIEFCYDYELDITKSVDPTYTRTFSWDIAKSVSPDSWDLFTGDSATSQYTVSLTKHDGVDSDWAVSGLITVTNNTPLDAVVEDVTDELSDFGSVDVDCGVDFSYTLPAGEKLVCSYNASLLDAIDQTNTATVVTSGEVGGDSFTADVTFGLPTLLVNDEVTVTDSVEGDLGTFSDSDSVTYDRTFTCEDEGTNGNTAEIVETKQEASASVEVACSDLEVTKDAKTSFTRTWDWTIDKSADQTDLTLASNQLFTVNYEVSVGAEKQDSAYAVTGAINITNPSTARDAVINSVSDVVSPDITGNVVCPVSFPYSLASGETLECSYTADLPDDADRVNTATATLQNYSFDPEENATPAGTTEFTGQADVLFENAEISEVDECIDVSDNNVGALGTVCAADAPKTFEYSLTFGQNPDADVLLECGPNTHENTASFVTNDQELTGESSWTVNADVVCDTGCTLTPGYWKTHSKKGPAPYDDTWQKLAEGVDNPEDTTFFLSGQSYYQVLWEQPQGNAYYILAHAYIAAELNQLKEASIPDDVLDAFDEATTLFNTYTPDQIAALKGKNSVRQQFVSLAEILDDYNNGLSGPGHCSEESSTDGAAWVNWTDYLIFLPFTVD